MKRNTSRRWWLQRQRSYCLPGGGVRGAPDGRQRGQRRTRRENRTRAPARIPTQQTLATDTDAAADASITIGDNGAVVASKGLTLAQLTQVRRAVAGPVTMSATGDSAASVSGVSIHHTWHWWGLHVWVDYTKSETNYLYYHSWTTAAEVAAVCGVVAAIDGWAGAGCLIAAGIQLGRILDGVDYAHDHGKGLRLDFNINWSGATWITTGTD